MTEELLLDEGFYIIKLENSTRDVFKFSRPVDRTYIQMHFCIKNQSKLYFGPHYALNINENNSYLLYNPNQNLPIDLDLETGSRQIIFIISIQVFHSFFSQVANLIHFLDDENKDKKYYLDKVLTPSEILVLNQIFSDQMHESLKSLYLRAKVYELLSLYFNKSSETNQSCPFLDDEENVDKIKKAKQIIIENMAEPPSLNKLASLVDLPLQKLNDGFKHIYGDSIFNFLLDYKLEYARKLMLLKKHNVSEISLQIGYSTSSHFISAFKKKYGTTPKQYMLNN